MSLRVIMICPMCNTKGKPDLSTNINTETKIPASSLTSN